jgi:hypothetical protein
MAEQKRRVRLVVRRGAQRRFDGLKAKAQDLPVEVTWDRRQDDRGPEGRVHEPGGERRAKPPFTWDLADFVVVTEAPRSPARPAPKRARVSSKR